MLLSVSVEDTLGSGKRRSVLSPGIDIGSRANEEFCPPNCNGAPTPM